MYSDGIDRHLVHTVVHDLMKQCPCSNCIGAHMCSSKERENKWWHLCMNQLGATELQTFTTQTLLLWATPCMNMTIVITCIGYYLTVQMLWVSCSISTLFTYFILGDTEVVIMISDLIASRDQRIFTAVRRSIWYERMHQKFLINIDSLLFQMKKIMPYNFIFNQVQFG